MPGSVGVPARDTGVSSPCPLSVLFRMALVPDDCAAGSGRTGHSTVTSCVVRAFPVSGAEGKNRVAAVCVKPEVWAMPALPVMKMPGDAGGPGGLQALLPQACHLLRQLTPAHILVRIPWPKAGQCNRRPAFVSKTENMPVLLTFSCAPLSKTWQLLSCRHATGNGSAGQAQQRVEVLRVAGIGNGFDPAVLQAHYRGSPCLSRQVGHARFLVC